MSPLLYGVEMNGYNHPTEAICSDATLRLPDRRVALLPQSRVLFLPLLAVMISLVVTELGLLFINDPPAAGAGLDPATAWILQSFITGQITIFLLSAWGHSLCRLRWPTDEPASFNLRLTAAAACCSWTTWMALRLSARVEGEPVSIFLIFTLPILAITGPLLWHAILTVRRPRHSLWTSGGFLAFTLLLQCWGTPRVVEDPANLFIVNSVVITGAVVLWLIVYSLPPTAARSRTIP